MTTKISITIPGDVKGKGRPQFSRKSGRAYTPVTTRTKEGIVASLAMDAMKGVEPFTGPIEMHLQAILAIPASWSKKRREGALLDQELPTKKPDLDNIVKLICDGLNGIVYVDDAQIVGLFASKSYGPHAMTLVDIYAAKVTQ